MQWLTRYYENEPTQFFIHGKVLILYGARRTGKTVLVKRLLNLRKGKIYYGTGEDMDLASLLASRSSEIYKLFFGNYETICIDEAQYIENIGQYVKLLVDQMPDTCFILTGSNSFSTAQSAGEPLTGRCITKKLFPIGLVELQNVHTAIDIYKRLEEFLVFGMYPEVLISPTIDTKVEYLTNLRNSYLLKDILSYENLKSSQKLINILKLLAYQIGSEVSVHEIATTIGLSKNTVERYIDLLIKSFVIVKVPAFSRNLRNEVSKSSKYYFLDTGIRNAVINNFSMPTQRDDIGALWENFVVIELLKKHTYEKRLSSFYFWRTYDQKELDLVIEEQGKLSAFEIKWNQSVFKTPKNWVESYNAPVTLINRNTLLALFQ